MTMKEVQEKLVVTLKKWQKIEEEAIASTSEVLSEMGQTIPAAIFKIIQGDAQNHRRIQEIIIKGHEKEGFNMTVEQLEDLSKVLSRHIEVETRMIEAANESLALIAGKGMVLHEYFLRYLQEDEKKHMDMLRGLENVKKQFFPYGPSA